MPVPDTYIILREIPISRQEADTGNLVFEVPEFLPITSRTITFQVIDRNEELIIEISGAQWHKNGQIISTTLNPADTDGLAGKHRWTLVVQDANTRYNIGAGPFTIIPKLAKYD